MVGVGTLHCGRASVAANSAMVADVHSSFLLTTPQSRRLKQYRKWSLFINGKAHPNQTHIP